MTLALVIAGGFVVSPTASASDGDCKGEGAFEKYVELEDPIVFETNGESGFTVAAYVPSDDPGLFHRIWTTIECGSILDEWLECILDSEVEDALETCMS